VNRSGTQQKSSAHVREIFRVERKSRSPKFKGIVVDSGAASSCIGLSQAIVWRKMNNDSSPWRKSTLSFKFGHSVYESLGKMVIDIPTPNGKNLCFICDIVNADVPLLLGLDVMIDERMIINVKEFKLQTDSWEVPLRVKDGHLVIQLTRNINFTRKQLEKFLANNCRFKSDPSKIEISYSIVKSQWT